MNLHVPRSPFVLPTPEPSESPTSTLLPNGMEIVSQTVRGFLTSQTAHVWTAPKLVATLVHPHACVDAYLTILGFQAIGAQPGQYTPMAVGDVFELNAILVAKGGGARGVVGRGAYRNPVSIGPNEPNGDPNNFRDLFLCSARGSGDSFDLFLQAGLSSPFMFDAQVTLVGYDNPNGNTPLPPLRVIETLTSATTDAGGATSFSKFFANPMNRPGWWHGFTAVNPSGASADVYLMFFDVAFAGGAVAQLADNYPPLETFLVPKGSQLRVVFDKPREIQSGLFWQVSTTPNLLTKQAPAANTGLIVHPEYA
jgi:hypothetical protein